MAFSGTQRHAEGPRHAVFTAPRPAKRLSTLSLTSAPPTSSLTLIAAVFHAQYGQTPLHEAAQCSSSVAVVQALLAANPEAAMARNHVRRPSPPLPRG